MKPDQLHDVFNGCLVARTCKDYNPDTDTFTEGCGAVLTMSDYGWVICENCEEPQKQEGEVIL